MAFPITNPNEWYLWGPSYCAKKADCGKCGQVTAVGLAVPSALLNVALFPLKAAVGAVALPIIGLVQLFRGKGDCKYLKAWTFYLLSAIAVFAFLALIAFVFPLIITVALLAAAIGISIIFHVKHACSKPQPALIYS